MKEDEMIWACNTAGGDKECIQILVGNWTKRLRVRTRPRQWIFKGDKNPQNTFFSDGK
jgi:hypothetical protein